MFFSKTIQVSVFDKRYIYTEHVIIYKQTCQTLELQYFNAEPSTC